MGNSASEEYYKNSEIKILVIGLYDAGKTSVMYQMKLGEMGTTMPPIAGFQFASFDVKGVKMTAWDIGLRCASSQMLKLYASEKTDAIVIVVDSSNEEHLEEVDQLLWNVIGRDHHQGIPLLVLANKQDKPEAMTVADITEKLGLNKIQDRQWNIVPTTATTGDGVNDGFDWLSQAVSGKLFTEDMKASVKTSVTEVKETSGKLSHNAWWHTKQLFKFMAGRGGSK